MLLSCFRPAIACSALIVACGPALAGDDNRFETYVTVDYSTRSAAFASSTVWSVFGPVEQSGFRLKISGLTSIDGQSNASVFSSSFMAADVATQANVMAGYMFQWQNIWIKLYAGAAYQVTSYHIQSYDFWSINTLLSERNFGAAAALETYWEAESGFWVSGNLSWIQQNNTASFYGRAAYKIMKESEGLNLSVGGETGVTVWDPDIYRDGKRAGYDEYVRGGALINLRYGSNELTLSGGLAADMEERGWRPYATVSYGRKF